MQLSQTAPSNTGADRRQAAKDDADAKVTQQKMMHQKRNAQKDDAVSKVQHKKMMGAAKDEGLAGVHDGNDPPSPRVKTGAPTGYYHPP